ncbi:hypothetical protein N7495_003236 [Penicillium taxi]|uniref:uncharacterized protein n=1 Tax=Penicillium taxi TaxID=168475 RepID=UPI0025452265|nr:uncharacterized protein N7495_003236 [Penicillium taxi]KAJ5902708.1 hypothetical protein N7495_003236 [Penicillium taxi]
MRFTIASLLGFSGLLSAHIINPVERSEHTNFLDIRPTFPTEYESEAVIPSKKYFTSIIIMTAGMILRPSLIPKFQPSNANNHRFANETLPVEQVPPHLTALIRTYLQTMSAIGAETWIIHGTLLSWWWNQDIFPWDSDLDVQISETTIHFLADYYNMTEHKFDIGEEGSRTYILEINPNYVVKSIRDRMNVIDGRWIDTSSGLFIDITAVRKDDYKREHGFSQALICKDKHHYTESQIFPLRESRFVGVPVKIPYAYTDLLVEEYGPTALTNKDFSGHHFNDETNVWERVT